MPDFSTLTERQRQIYDFIRQRIDGRGFPPTVREIGENFAIKSPNGVMCHLKALEKKGLIHRDTFSARAIQLVDPPARSNEVRLLGRVAAGQPIAAVEEMDERLNLSELFVDPNHFALKVRGQSMIEDHIDDGDYVIIRRQETATVGERVVAMIDGEATLKRYHRERGQIRLDPANGAMQPIYVAPDKDVQILGVLVGVLRKC